MLLSADQAGRVADPAGESARRETVVWQDEIEIHTDPKIGRKYMFKERQAVVQTPGTNQKSHHSDSIHWQTGQVWVTEAATKQGRNVWWTTTEFAAI